MNARTDTLLTVLFLLLTLLALCVAYVIGQQQQAQRLCQDPHGAPVCATAGQAWT